MRKEQIKELIKLVEESNITELEVSEGRNRIRISKAGPQPPVVSIPAAIAQTNPSNQTSPSADSSEPATGGHAEAEPLASNLKQITSPMVGTFYRAPAPGAEPFVDEGQTVVVGQTVCIVEAMKLMNEIGSDFNGVVRSILIENAQPVEYGQPLFLIEVR
jgi:acetyl-CoA carboxylase biotin carboxyl carrier protein